MGKNANAEIYRKLEQQSRHQYREDDDRREQQYDEWMTERYEREIQQMRGDW
jgi:hypothetical protein